MTSLHSCSSRRWFIVVSVERVSILPPRWLRYESCYTYIFTRAMFPLDDARSGRWHTEESRRRWTNFYFVLSPLFISIGRLQFQRWSVKGFCCSVCGRLIILGKIVNEKSMGTADWTRLNLQNASSYGGGGNDGDVIDPKPTVWSSRGWKINPSWINAKIIWRNEERIRPI